MEGSAPIRATVLDGTHKGKMGTIVSKTEYYTKIRLADDTIIRCKNAFAEEIPDLDMNHEVPNMNEDDLLLQEMIIASMMQQEKEQKEKDKEKAKHHSEMIQKQNAEYEASLKKDLVAQEAAPQLVFEEVSKEEMRRVRLLRFG
mgnify:CR=1 FL=1